ncbi:hypothetical protein DdX_01626 [Ditylenchus destructor]|uniref:Uncharacterized protein n=1 Tax=Ditylenchus destructor TaxID=166010 RepID=A0AAD4NH47_9BILA|nr:hypothetical protein DdX_01626 [Ditylenchus destructor]
MWRCHVHPLGYAPKPHAPPTPPVVVLRMRIVPPGQSKESSPSSGSWVYDDDETLPASTGLFLPYGPMSPTTEGYHRRRWPQIAALAKVIGTGLSADHALPYLLVLLDLRLCWLSRLATPTA